MLNNLYFVIPDNLLLAIEKAQWFLNGGKDDKEDSEGRRLYSFSNDLRA